ncbi:MAG TPA: hypothetical protein DIS82_09280 [Exiguobacterium sp.]|uniref:FixH family protein n=1 Tax=Exiguobacterium sp. TaxID=44751 RepID=UPI000ED4A655|nr:FixH family protein [Exiguobacterium sp.]HCN58339.1 hypothetical protein [Exiguobacterium sp.]
MRKSIKGILLSGLIVTSSGLAGCAVTSDAAQQYAVSIPLSVKFEIPKVLKADQEKQYRFGATLWQDQHEVKRADYVHFEIWKADGTLRYSMEPADETKPGMYSIKKTLPKNGLYYIKVHASSNGAMIMPTRQFIVGELSANDLKILQGGAKPAGGSSGHHH